VPAQNTRRSSLPHHIGLHDITRIQTPSAFAYCGNASPELVQKPVQADTSCLVMLARVRELRHFSQINLCGRFAALQNTPANCVNCLR
jgi:hypothetical protein